MDFWTLFFKKTLRYVLKPLSFLPAIFMIYIIFFFSSQEGDQSSTVSYEVSKTIVLAYNKIMIKGYPNEILNTLIEAIHPYIRKMAHFAEYFLLSVTVVIPLYVYKIRGIFLLFTGGIFCVLVAFLDEYRQSFVAGRGPSIKDVGIDSLGALFGLIFAWIICYIGRKTIFRFLSLEDYRKNKKSFK